MSNASRESGGLLLNGGGFAAQRLMANNMDIRSLRTNDVLRKEEWIHYDQAVVDVARERLNGVADLQAAGLTFNLPNALGTTIVQWERQTDMQPATRSMEGLSRGMNDRVEFELINVPVYITHVDFFLSLRHLSASRKMGTPIDTTQAQVASRKVAESLEDALFNGSGIQVAQGGSLQTAYGYRTHPDRNAFLTVKDWSAAATTGEEVVNDLLVAMGVLDQNSMFGPYNLYVPTAVWNRLQGDFKSNSDRTTVERIQAISALNAIKPADLLPAKNAVLVQMTSDVVDLVDGQQPTTVQWETNGGFLINFKVMSILVPRVKSTARKVSVTTWSGASPTTSVKNQSGIVHITMP